MLCKFFLVFWLAATLFFFIPIPIPYLSGWLFAVFASIINMNPESLAIVSFRFVCFVPKWNSKILFIFFPHFLFDKLPFILFCFVLFFYSPSFIHTLTFSFQFQCCWCLYFEIQGNFFSFFFFSEFDLIWFDSKEEFKKKKIQSWWWSCW